MGTIREERLAFPKGRFLNSFTLKRKGIVDDELSASLGSETFRKKGKPD